MTPAIIALASLFFLGHGLKWFFLKTKIPDLLILVFLGYLAGPILGLVDQTFFGEFGPLVSTTALIVILYEGGLHLSTKDLIHSSLPSLGLSFLSFTSITILASSFTYLLGQPWHLALLLGIGIGSTSSAIVIPMVKNLSVSSDTKTILSLESAFTDVLAIVIFLVLADSVVSEKFDLNTLLISIGPKTLNAALMGAVLGLLWAFIKEKFNHLIPIAFAGEAWALLSYGLIELSGHNGAIGVLSLGFILANLNLVPRWLNQFVSDKPVSYRDLTLLSEITFLLRTFFFLYLGILIKFSSFSIVATALALSLFILLSRYLCIHLIFKSRKAEYIDALIATAMGPRGLACAVLATIPIQKGIVGGEWIQDTIFAVIPISILFTATLVAVAESKKTQMIFAKFFLSFLPKQAPNKEMATRPEEILPMQERVEKQSPLQPSPADSLTSEGKSRASKGSTVENTREDPPSLLSIESPETDTDS